VWDVGANVGYYTHLFSERVGPSGKVFAFEPSSQNFVRLRERCELLLNVELINVGLGSKDTTLEFLQGDDNLGATSRIVEDNGSDQFVSIRSGDSLLQEGAVDPPNVLKIDVEGFEWEVINGLQTLIRNRSLTAIGVEVHFGLLQQRGDTMAPQRLERFLRDAGFTITWPDPSHILGVREAL
jgi:FkbM family methyltransferase